MAGLIIFISGLTFYSIIYFTIAICIYSTEIDNQSCMYCCLQPFNQKSYFCSWDNQISLFPSFPLFFPVSHCFRAWSKINLKVYDAINCLNKNSITHFVWYLEKEKRYDTETLSIDGVSNKEHFYGKIMQKICSKS